MDTVTVHEHTLTLDEVKAALHEYLQSRGEVVGGLDTMRLNIWVPSSAVPQEYAASVRVHFREARGNRPAPRSHGR